MLPLEKLFWFLFSSLLLLGCCWVFCFISETQRTSLFPGVSSLSIIFFNEHLNKTIGTIMITTVWQISMLICTHTHTHTHTHTYICIYIYIYRNFSQISATLGNSATIIHFQNNYWGISATLDQPKDAFHQMSATQ